MLENLFIFGVVIVTTYLLINRVKQRRFLELSKNLPGHDGLSVFKSIWLLLTLPRKNYVTKILSFVQENSPMTKIWLMNNLLILTKDADFINKVFNMPQTYNKPDVFYQGFLFTKGLITLNGNEHKRHRRILNKGFMPKMMLRLPEIFDEKSKKILEFMDEREDCGEFDLLDYLGTYSLETFGKSHLNHEIDFFQSKIFDALERYPFLMMDVLPYLILNINMKIIEVTKLGRDISTVLGNFHKFVYDVVKANHMNNGNVSAKNTITELLLDPKNDFDDADVQEELSLALVGAFETTTKTISTVLMMLGIYKNIQQKIVDEIEEAYSNDANVKFTSEFLQKFPYLEMVIKESMRLFPVVPFVARTTSEEVEINGCLLPKGVTIFVSIYGMHRNEKFWGNDAHLFRPERFQDRLENSHAFAPFTGGSRICLGYRYAMMSMKIFLINFFRTYKVHCSSKFEDLVTEMTLTLNFVDGYKVCIRRK